MQEPTIGRIVFHIDVAKKIRPAIVVAVLSSYLLNLRVFADGFPSEDYWATGVQYADADYITPNSWHWPPRV